MKANFTREWEGQDAFLIGGGTSLKGFDFSKLAGKHVIGINEAFKLGPEIVELCYFGDGPWFARKKWELEKFGNPVVTNSPTLKTIRADWFIWCNRVNRGLSTDINTLGWNGSSGASAINLALNLGAARVFLLGFDLKTAPDRSTHWHDHYKNRTPESSFLQFLNGFKLVARDLPEKFPKVKVYNVQDDPNPRLSFFSTITFHDLETNLGSRRRKK